MGTVDRPTAHVLFTPLRRIETNGGDVYHGMKNSDSGFCGFGEAYFSAVNSGYVKGWKRHSAMTLNLLVPAGLVQIAVVDDSGGNKQNFILGPESPKTYGRLTIPPRFWVAFGGMDTETSMLLNIASIPHDPNEAESCILETFPWAWVKND